MAGARGISNDAKSSATAIVNGSDSGTIGRYGERRREEGCQLRRVRRYCPGDDRWWLSRRWSGYKNPRIDGSPGVTETYDLFDDNPFDGFGVSGVAAFKSGGLSIKLRKFDVGDMYLTALFCNWIVYDDDIEVFSINKIWEDSRWMQFRDEKERIKFIDAYLKENVLDKIIDNSIENIEFSPVTNCISLVLSSDVFFLFYPNMNFSESTMISIHAGERTLFEAIIHSPLKIIKA